MARFCELGVEADVVIGKGIDMEELFNRRRLPEMNKERWDSNQPLLSIYPIDITIVKVGKCFQFT